MSWQTFRNVVNVLFQSVSIALALYLGASMLGFVKSSPQHYSTFIFAICLASGFIALRMLADRKLAGEEISLLWFKMAFTLTALVLSAISTGYVRWNADRLELVLGQFTDRDMFFGWMMVVSILMLNWIHWGGLLTTIVALSIVYFFYGYLIPNPFLMTPEYDTKFIMNYLGLGTTQGFFMLANDAADNIYFLVLYAAVLFGLGMLGMMLEVGKVMGNRVPGGAAGPAVVGSGIVAAIMGTAVSNVVMTGRLTIPMMKKYGYSSSMAGSIEATASTAGQIMPPVLGLAAFLIAAFLNKPYVEVALAAVIPGFLYLVGVSIGIYVYARRNRLPKTSEPIETAMIWRMMPAFLASFGVVVWMLVNYYSPSLAGLYGIAVALVVGLIVQGPYRPSLKQFLEAMDEGLYLVAALSILLIAIGPLGQVFLTTGLSGKLGAYLITILPNTQLMLLFGAMIAALILGMGLPTPVAYLIVALALVPFMQQIGLKPLQAHFFVFYFAVYSTLTPPVAVSVFAAAKLSGAGFVETAIDSMKLALTTFIIPFAFVFAPELMSFPNVTLAVLREIGEVVLIQWLVSVAAYGYCFRDLNGLERMLFAVAGVLGFLAMTIGEGVGHWHWHYALWTLTLLLTGWMYLTRKTLGTATAG
ncbi:MAG: TRAP transporter fused permease subunit [Hyphomicrobiaceae bacterium]